MNLLARWVWTGARYASMPVSTLACVLTAVGSLLTPPTSLWVIGTGLVLMLTNITLGNRRARRTHRTGRN